MADERRPPHRRVARTYRLDAERIEQIDGLAGAYGVWPSEIADILLRIGLDELEAGRRQLIRKPVRFAVALEAGTSKG